MPFLMIVSNSAIKLSFGKSSQLSAFSFQPALGKGLEPLVWLPADC
jgi:hypothetical protein